uniref:Putative yth domain protein n=1 Tax=Nyssomyia neivai TaxID=330878 RepID=A0A1L8DBZ4_9DIPT
MSAVSDQRMKGQGNQDYSDEYESWRQQPGNYVPSDQYNAGAQFQYPPFGVNDGTWSSGNENLAILGGYSQHDNYGVDMFGPSFGQQQSSYNYFPGNGGDYNTWGTQQVNTNQGGPQQHQRKQHYDEYYREQQGGYQHDIKAMEQGMQGLGIENNPQMHHEKESSSNTVNSKVSHHDHHQPKESIPKKMTWASVASQPAKPQVNTTTSTVKKKGPGMPPPPMVPGKHNLDIGTWDSPSKNGPMMVPPPVVTAIPPPVAPSPLVSNQKSSGGSHPQGSQAAHSSSGPQHPGMGPPQQQQMHPQQQHGPNDGPNTQNMRPAWSNRPMQGHPNMGMPPPPHQRPMGHGGQGPPMMMSGGYQGPPPSHQQAMQQPPPPPKMPPKMQPASPSATAAINPNVLEQLQHKNNYNPLEMTLEKVDLARFFVIKSYSEDDIHRSIKYEIWCSTEHGNKRLDQAFREREREGGVVYLFFSVNGSGHFCGIAQMISNVDYNSNSSVWSQDKWKGTFKVRWVYVKDVPNTQLRHIRLENNENKAVTNSRDTQEVPHPKGIQVYKIIHAFKHTTSIFDDFVHYDKRQEEEDSRKHVDPPPSYHSYDRHFGNHNNPYDKPHHGYERGGGSGGYDKPPMKGYNRGGGFEGKHQQYNNYRRPPPMKDHYDDFIGRNNSDREQRPMERHDGAGYNNNNREGGREGGGRPMGHRDHYRGGRGSGGANRGHRN